MHKIAYTAQARISNHIIHTYGDTVLDIPYRRLIIIVCCIAFHVVRKPKPNVNPKAMLAIVISLLLTAMGLKLGERRVNIMSRAEAVDEAHRTDVWR